MTAGAAARRAMALLVAALVAGAQAPPAMAQPVVAAAIRPQDPPAVGSAAEMTLRERLLQPVTADFSEVEFAAAVSFLADSAKLNILLSEKAKELAKPVTIHLVEMPLFRALEYLLKGQGLLYRLDGDALWIATRDEMDAEPMETRVYALNQGPGLSASFEPLADTRESVALQATALREMKTIKNVLDEVIPKVGSSSMLLDERSGSLIVTHAPYYLQQIERLVAELDVLPQQVLIEARFIEVTMTDTAEWGFDAALTGNAALTKKDAPDGSTQAPSLQFSSTGTTLARGSKFDFTDFTNQTAGNGLNLTLQGILTGTQYQAVLHALAQNKKTKTLSAPRVTALNNQTATIKIVTEFVYATRYQPSVVREDLNGDGDFLDTVSGKKETRFVNVPQGFLTKDLGIMLHVTPSVGQDQKTITLALKPEVSEKKTDDSFGGEVTLPRFTARELETSVVIENGETVMLGGLMKDTTAKTRTQIPVLGSLPVLGPLFRKDDTSVERSNLLIFVTARLLNSSASQLARQEPPEF